MIRFAHVALFATLVGTSALAAGTLDVTMSDRGAAAPHSPEAQRIFALIAAEDS